MSLLDHHGTWTPDDRGEQQCRSVPFEVPPGVDAVHVELSYDPEGGAVLDLGCEGPSGYVGWSGGARREFLVSERWSTPGYLRSRVEPGVWQVLLGLHRVPSPGVEYAVRVSAASLEEVAAQRDSQLAPPPVPDRPPGRALPSPSGLRWLAGDFHAHTLHSDGALSVDQLAALAVEQGLDVLAVTDHNTTSHHAELGAASARYGVQLVPGQEVTTDRGHANAFGDIGFVDFRRPGAQWQRDVTERGGVLSVNHPLALDCCWRMELDAPTAVAEVWHSSWRLLPILHSWGGPLAWWLTWSRATTPIGGSDFHERPDALPGSPTTWLLAADGEPPLDVVRGGRTAVSASATGPALLRLGDELVAVDAEGLLLTGFDAGRRRVTSTRMSFSSERIGPGPWWLEDDHMAVEALVGAGSDT